MPTSTNLRTRVRTSSERLWSSVRAIEAPTRKRASITRMRNSASITSASDITAVMLAASLLTCEAARTVAAATLPPQRLAIYHGYPSLVDGARRRAAVRAVHMRRLSAFMNAFVTDDVFQGDDSADAEAAGRLGADDAVLIESFGIKNGEAEPASRIAARATAALKWRDRSGVK